MDMLWDDLRYALRLMRRSPGFTAVAVLSLALGIGANTAIFSLFYTVTLRTLPVAHPEQLVEFLYKDPGQPRSDGYRSWDEYENIRDHSHVFSALTGMTFDNLASVHVDGGEPETVILEDVLGNYFQVLGLKPAIGRLSGPEDVPANGEAEVAVVSWSYWNRWFHRDPAILGKRIFVNNAPKTVIGVAPRVYTGPRVGNRTDVWIPYQKNAVRMLARLNPGVTLRQAEAEVNVLYHSWLEQNAAIDKNPRLRQRKAEVEPAGAGLARVRDLYGKSLVLLLAVVGLLLLLACINMASMLLARSAGRQREMAVRVALGASRGRLVRQMLTESLLLSGAGTVMGVLLAYFATGVLVRIMASAQPHQHVEIEVTPDLNLLLFTAGIAVLTGLLFGLAPAWYAFRSAPASHLRQSGRDGDTWLWRLFGKALVSAQVALSIFLVTGAAVFLSHLSRLRNFDLGFRSDHVLMMTLDPTRSGYKREQLAAPYQELLARLESIPGVRSVSISGCTPIQGCGSGVRYVNVAGVVERPEDRRWSAVSFVAPNYFQTLGIPILAGRDFSLRDASRSRVAIVNETMARHYFHDENPIGKHFSVDRNTPLGGWHGDDRPYEIVGVVGNSKSELRVTPPPAMYFNMFQEGQIFHQFSLRTSVDPASVTGAARQMMRDVLKNVPVTRVKTLSEQVDSAIVPERLLAALSEFFGALGAVLAGIGLYGLLAYTVARRINEIGVRMALGATAGDVGRLVLRDALGMVGAGLVVGVAMVLWSRPVVERLVEDLKLESVAALAWGGGVIVAIALLAAYVPARRAAGVDPMVALRHE
ncbi:MAG TPA: ABC transporter permease, partial [Bryobacteraceae bacterium]|nr:ABC transporter permease [Bryobacteraceae bacterium]